MTEQLSKEDAKPSKFSPQHIKNLAKTIEQNRATGQYLFTNANTGENASINLLRHQCTRISEKKYQKPNKSRHVHSSTNRSNLHSPTKRVIHNGMTMMKVTIKITKTK